MNNKYKVMLSYYTYSTILNDIDAFRFYKNNGDTNKNKFINKLITNYYEIVNLSIKKLEDNLLSLLKDIKNKEELVNDILKIKERNDDSDSKKEYELTFISTKESNNALLDIEYSNYSYIFTMSGYLRKLFNDYAKLNQDERERIIFKSEIDLINTAIKNNKKIFFKVITKKDEEIIEEKHEVSPLGIFNSKDRQFAYLIYYTSSTYNVINLYKLVDLRISRNFKDELSSSLNEKINGNLDKNDPQFINSPIIKCKIKLTKKGQKMFTKIFINRPKPLKIEDDIYYFECSINQLFQYFSRFGSEALVLDNEKLTNRLFKFYYFGYKNIKKYEK